MPYDAPKTLRRRQLNAENRTPRRTRQPREIRVMTDEEWERVCDVHLFALNAQAWQRHADAAGRHARTLVTMAVQRRACQLMRDLGLRSAWKAMDIARHELLNVEVAQ